MKNLTRFYGTATAFALGMCTVAPLQAQKASKDCVPDTKAAWYRTQIDFYAQDSKHDWSNDTLRTKLLEAVHSPPDPLPIVFGGEALRGSSKPQWTASSVSPEARELLLGLAKQRQWPTRSLVGAAGVHAALVIAQRDSVLANMALHRMMEAGMGESLPADVAVLEDAIRLINGRKQLYATHFIVNSDGSFSPAPTEDIAHVDLRRDAAGLPPLEFAQCRLRQQKN
jgi:hypothetical protein